jgi:predicted RNase H-like nuclease (RuvC/YqgF family)
MLSKKKQKLDDFLNEILRLMSKHANRIYKYMDTFDEHLKNLDNLITATENNMQNIDNHVKELTTHVRSVTSRLDMFDLYPKEIVMYGKMLNKYSKKFDDYLIEAREFRQSLSDYIKKLSENNQIIREFSTSLHSYLKLIYNLLYPLKFDDFKEELLKLGINIEKIEKIKHVDSEGKFLVKDSHIEFNIYKSENQNYLLEIKNFVDNEIAEFLIYKSKIFSSINNENFKKVVLALVIEKDAYNLLQNKGFNVIYKFII